jgi:hypothetical protein
MFTKRLRHLGLTALAVVLAATGLTFVSAGGPARADGPPVPWGPAQQVPGMAALSGGDTSELVSMSCASPGNCTAGGLYNDTSHHMQAFVVSEAGGVWGSALPVPGLAALNAGNAALVLSVSCASAGNCTAGGTYEDAGFSAQAFVVSQANGAWGTAQEVPGTAALNAGGEAEVQSVSCPTAASCAATGYYFDASGVQQAFAANRASGTWGTAQEIPGTAALNAGGEADAVSVSCPADGSCAAVGHYLDAAGRTQPYLVTFSGGTWGTAQPVPGMATLNAGGYGPFSSVACASAANCVAGGSYMDAAGHQQAFTVALAGGTLGSAQEVPGTAALNVRGSAGVSSVACPAAGSCAAAGWYFDGTGHNQPFTVTQSGGAWANAQPVPGIGALQAGTNSNLSSISCSTPGNCGAGGTYVDAAGHGQALVVTETGGTWGTAQAIPALNQLNAGGLAGVQAISCPGDGTCTVGGLYDSAASRITAFTADATNIADKCVDGEMCALADVNGDGKADAVSFVKSTQADPGAGDVWVALSAGSGLGAAVKWSDSMCVAAQTCALGDVGGDGKADAVSFDPGSGDVWVGVSSGSAFGVPVRWSDPKCVAGETCALADVNGDGRADAVSFAKSTQADPGAGDVWVALSTGSGFAAPVMWSDSMCVDAQTCALADVNGDGNADAISFDPGSGDRWVALSTGSGFVSPVKSPGSVCAAAVTCAAGDVNGDGNADAVSLVKSAQFLGSVLVTLAPPPAATVPASHAANDGIIWNSLAVASRPDQAGLPNGALELFEVDPTSNRAVHRWQQAPDGWTNWQDFTGNMASIGFKDIAAATNADGRVEAFAIGLTDHRVFHRWEQTPGAQDWTDWQPFATFSDPDYAARIAVGRNLDGRLEMFASTAGGHMWHVFQQPGGWAPWQQLDSNLPFGQVGVAAQMAPSGLMYVFTSARDTVYFRRQGSPSSSNLWTDWLPVARTSSGKVVAPKLAAGRDANGNLEVFFDDLDGHLASATQTGTDTWTAPATGLWAGISANALAVGRNSDGRLQLFAMNNANALLTRWQRVPNGITGWLDHFDTDLDHPAAAPGFFPLQAAAGGVTVTWSDRSDNETSFVVQKLNVIGDQWVDIYSTMTQDSPGTSGSYSYTDTDTSRSGQCYRIRALNLTSLRDAGTTDQECTVRPDPARFPQAIPDSAFQWAGFSRVNGATDNDMANESRSFEHYLWGGDQTWGVNLDWYESPGPWIVQSELSGGGPNIMLGQAVAIGVDDGHSIQWLRHGHETFGVDLVLSSTPSYEWYIIGDKGADTANAGQVMDDGIHALWNSDAHAYLVAGDQTFGVNLDWFDPSAPPPGGGITQPPAAASGVGQLRVFNCDAAQHAVSVWIKDGGGSFQQAGAGPLPYQGDPATGGCAAKDSQPLIFTPTGQHAYQVVITDPRQAGCTADDPTNNACVEESRTITGNPGGAIETTTVGVGTDRSPFAFNWLNQ